MMVNRIKLMKHFLKFGTMASDKGELYYEGAVEKGLEVFVEDEKGEMIPAPDGEYTVEKQIFVIVEGKIAEIKEVAEAPAEPVVVEAAEEPVVEPVVDEKVAELEAKVAEKDAKIAELEAKIAELETKLGEKEAEVVKLSAEPTRQPAHIEVNDTQVVSKKDLKTNPALRFFNAN